MGKNPPCGTVGRGLIPGRGTKIPRAAGQLCLCAAVKIPCAPSKLRHSHINKYFKNYSTYTSLENRQILGFEHAAEEGTALPAQVLRHVPISDLRFWLNGSQGLCCQDRPVPSGVEPALQRGWSSLQWIWRVGLAFRVGGRGGENQGPWREELPFPAQRLTWWSTQYPISPGCRPGHVGRGRSASPGYSAQPRWHYKFTLRTFAMKGVGRGLESHRVQPGTWAAVLMLTGRWQCWASKGSCPGWGLPLPGVRASLESRVGQIVQATPATRGVTQDPMALPTAVVRPG